MLAMPEPEVKPPLPKLGQCILLDQVTCWLENAAANVFLFTAEAHVLLAVHDYPPPHKPPPFVTEGKDDKKHAKHSKWRL